LARPRISLIIGSRYVKRPLSFLLDTSGLTSHRLRYGRRLRRWSQAAQFFQAQAGPQGRTGVSGSRICRIRGSGGFSPPEAAAKTRDSVARTLSSSSAPGQGAEFKLATHLARPNPKCCILWRVAKRKLQTFRFTAPDDPLEFRSIMAGCYGFRRFRVYRGARSISSLKEVAQPWQAVRDRIGKLRVPGNLMM